MLFSEECDSLGQLMESGCAVNVPNNPLSQSPAHLAVCGGQAFFLLWQLQTGLDINQQDTCGETLIHKAARSGSLECLSVLVAREAKLNVCNKDGQTAEDLALSSGFMECAHYLAAVRNTRDTFLKAQSSMHELRDASAGHKRGHHCGSVLHGKRRRASDDGFI
ncbi:ankyrin repeat domain-containing protein 37 [Bombina bombina]|uniref:ankyrin repeat domain-containing protein 37 n=1 Tax=Bombina bombina TaxID=8345 RepID=UPI00235A561A|nr:ankyrin repeat domain-containing protein 37 [Bombina bombina]